MTRGRAEMIRNLMDCSSIELKVISCRDLRAFNFFQKLSVYTVVSIFNDEMKDEQQNHLQLQKTPVDRDGNGNPEWNHTMHFDIKPVSLNVDNYDHWFIKFDMCSEGIVFMKKSLGKVRVPFKDLIDEFNEAVRYMSYQVRTSDGKPNGVLNFSYKVIGKNNNNNISGSIHESQDTESPSGIHYPTLELEQNQSQGICYPSLDDIVPSDLLPRIHVPSPNFCHWRPESDYNMSLPPPPPPPPLPFSLPAAVPAGVHHHHHHRHHHPGQPPGPYWYPSDLRNHGYSFCRNPSGVGQLGMVDHSDSWRSTSPEDRSDIPQVPDSGTTNGSCN